MILFFDCESNGLPKDYKAPMQVVDNWPRVIQLAWLLSDYEGNTINQGERLIRPDCWTVPKEKFWIDHGFSQEKSMKEGIWIRQALTEFLEDQTKCELMVSHNIAFDYNVVGAEMIRYKMKGKKVDKICTMETTINFCCIPFEGQRAYMSKKEGKFKWPKLEELYKVLFKKDFEAAHSAGGDVAALKECFFELVKRGIIKLQYEKTTDIMRGDE